MEANNMAAMREALKLCGSRMCRLCKELELARSMLNKRPLGVFCHPDKCMAYQAAHTALALPPRQCDVGTAEDQYKRFRDYCYSKRCESLTTPNTLGSEVAFAWAQMPYKKGGAE